VKLLGAIEAGGTKFVCGVGTGPSDLRTVQFPTTTPGETIGAAIDFFRREAGADLEALGIGSFGPVDLKRTSPQFGFITATPKPGWQYTDVAGPLADALQVPVGFDTDVNAAALGEKRWGAARDVESCLYLTIGTGIGGGAIVNGRILHGIMHPEMGHIRIPHDLAADPYPGHCPFHGDCLEGLASGPAMQSRWDKCTEELPADHPAWALEARYLALAVANFIFTLSPGRVILGGGVMQQAQLFPLIRAELLSILNGYLQVPHVLSRLDTYVVPPALGNRSGVLGALALAESAEDSY
jgi:fructokinase